MAKKTKSYHHGDLARALVLAGRDLLQEQGIDALSLRTVAAQVGVSRTAPYAHFPDKKSLLRAICATGFADLTAAMEARRAPDLTSANQIIAFGEAYVAFALEHLNLYRLMISIMTPVTDTAAEPDSQDQLVIVAQRPYALLLTEFALLVRDPKRAEILSQGAWSAVHGLASLIGDGLITPPPEGAGEILRILMETQARPPAQSGGG
ncbi:TetR/AcrR family transcriptional regulator [Pseudophaeobacter sp.]|uniref:TetR/AcrR family transcriptional regulator n=1 Tax=Pseudophaeobacter sp. TaxID=1971739 RepID=UPI003296E167